MTQQTVDWTHGQGEPREQRQQRAIKHGGLVDH
jgi:hypothetical protein